MTVAPPASDRPAPGTPVTFRWRKWDGAPHWVHESVYLGRDEWGDWIGQQAGWRSARPGRDVVAESPNVTLVPAAGTYACTVNAAPARIRIYIDLAWDVRWSTTDADVIEGIDMDLDVVRALDDRGLYIDDRDEWEDHLAHYGYPAEVIAHLEPLALDLERRVGAHEPPFDDATADRWFARLAALGPSR
ncbi:DUF402 domain-containing protein [Microbacterium sp. cx-55]|uniref:DUF402 domain-containing protein n=1 Tax=Microbacterium sp. cx-55 TaxID=2875948 RepID=UPI001CC00F04|nr:DUF402 domain-containing protein [Microbacterium sp. cx-55]UGB34723.1 DUF402 domain-containing protein [Microbacterium sp. cx-55]